MRQVSIEKDPYRWVILALAWLVYFAFGLILSSVPPLATTITTDLSLSYSQMGAVLGSVILMYVPFAIPTGVIIDRIGHRKMITAGLILISSSAILRVFATNFETLFLTVVIFGLGGPTISVGLPKVVASAFLGRERGLASGIYMTGFIIGSAIALALTNALILPLMGTWRNTFLLYGIVGLIIAAAWILLVKQPTSMADRSSLSAPLRVTLPKLLGIRSVWIVAIIGTSGFLIYYGFGNWLPTLLESKGFNAVDAGLLASFPTWIGLIGSVFIPSVVKAGKRRPIIILILFLQGVSIIVVGIEAGLTLLIALTVYGIFSGAMMPVLLVVLMDLPDVGAEYTGIASGVYFSVGAMFGFIGPTIVGYLTDITGTFLPAIILLALVMEGMIALVFLLKDA
ncbi:MAG: MFS transporter [Candidatus Thorarchaeota archaeon]|jgi:cyanate permease